MEFNNSIYYDDEDEIKDLLLGRKITVVNEDTLELDNGIILKIIPNQGCSCGAGEYYITSLNGIDNAITKVITYEAEGEYGIFVYADNIKVNVLDVQGDDGNGYYGSGYHIDVMVEDRQESDNE